MEQRKYWSSSYLIPLLYSSVVYIILWTFGWGKFYNEVFFSEINTSFGWTNLPFGFTIVLFFIITGVFGMAGKAATAMGEEIGWRGYLVPELFKSFSYTKPSVISGSIWSIWHFPTLIFADYSSGTPYWYGLTCFLVIIIISISFIFTWFRIKANSLWTGLYFMQAIIYLYNWHLPHLQ